MTRPPAPQDPGALFQKAVGLHRAGKMLEAVAAYERVVAVAPGHVAARCNLGVALRSLRRPDAALAAYDAAIAIRPDYAEAHANRGNVLQDLRRFDEAVASLETAITLRPDDATALNNLGNALMNLGRPEAALARYEAAIALKPDYAMAHFNRGITLAGLERFDEALASYDAAIAIRPDYAEAHGNRGNLLVDLQRFEEGLGSLRTLLTLRPDDPAAHNKLGNALLGLGQHEAAIACFDAALAIDPDYAEGRLNRGLCLLALGRFSEGWRDYEHRWGVGPYVRNSSGQVTPALRARVKPMLAPSELAGRSVLVVGEQGVGDVVMFSSMLPDLLKVAGRVAILCEPRLKQLLSASFPGVTIHVPAEGDQIADGFDHILPIASLGWLFRNRREDFPGRPFLTPRPETRVAWAGRLGAATTRLRVGLSWRGGTARTGQRDRSIALEDLRPLLDLPDCEVFNLQYGDARQEVEEINGRLARPIRSFDPREIDDFEDLAALVRSLDVVVSVQTSLVHVAGAVGAPVLVMLPFVTPWRYGAEPSSMLWYESATLFRQDETRTWAPVIARVAERLAAFKA